MRHVQAVLQESSQGVPTHEYNTPFQILLPALQVRLLQQVSIRQAVLKKKIHCFVRCRV